MLLLALSFHSVFEGVAIGLQDNSGQFFSIVIAVMVHKVVMAFSLGLNIAQSDLNLKKFLISTVIFSLASPLGVGVGILMMGLPPSLTRDICNGFLQGDSQLVSLSDFYVTFQGLLVGRSSTSPSSMFYRQPSTPLATDCSKFSS